MLRTQKIKIAKTVILNICINTVLMVLTFAKIDLYISPFAFAFLFAGIYLNANKIAMGTSTFLFSLFVSNGRSEIIANIVATTLFFILAWMLPILKNRYGKQKFFKKYKVEFVIIFLMFSASNVLRIVFASQNPTNLYIAFISLCIGIIFLIVCLIFFNAMSTRFNKIPWTPDQKICTGVLIIIISLGLMGLRYDYLNLHKFITVLLILVTAFILDSRNTLVVAACLGLGASLVDLDLVHIAVYILFALAAISFKSYTKYLSVIAVMATDIVLGIYFRAYFGYGFLDALPIILASLCALILPYQLEKHFNFSQRLLSGHLVSKNTINKNRAGVYKRLDNLGSVFNEMQNIYKNLVIGSVPPEESAKLISRHLVDNICSSCNNRPTCRRDTNLARDIDAGFEKLCFIGLQRGSVNFMDLSPDISIRCTKLNVVLNMANNSVSHVQNQEAGRLKTDAGKILMAGLLSGLHRLCKSFAQELGSEVIFDINKGKQIKDALLNAGIVVSDCLITKNKGGEYTVSVLVTRNDAQNRVIERVISNIAGHLLQVDSIDDADTAGFSIVTVRTAPRYNLTFGIAQVSKDFNLQNGDAFSFLKVTSDKTMMSVCDGMGTGERAQRASVLALSLVENFYKAGFPNEIIMESVNQLLILTGQEGFSAIDIAVFSLADGEVNFIKVGGVDGFIKRAMEVEVIEAGSLPLGIVEEMIPKITRAFLGAGDMAIIVSDGVLDSFGDRVALANFINNAVFKTPQNLADEIIAECLRRTDKIAIDDCTVAVARMDACLSLTGEKSSTHPQMTSNLIPLVQYNSH